MNMFAFCMLVWEVSRLLSWLLIPGTEAFSRLRWTSAFARLPERLRQRSFSRCSTTTDYRGPLILRYRNACGTQSSCAGKGTRSRGWLLRKVVAVLEAELQKTQGGAAAT